MSNERFVQVREVEEGKAPIAFQGEGDMEVPKALEFKVVERRYFRAEHTMDGSNIVIHFFVSAAMKESWTTTQIEHWWLKEFATKLSDAAQEYFQATVPRIMAKYTAEVASWWFKAQGYDYLLDYEEFLRAFYERLDETLNSALLPEDEFPRGMA